jgi:hypothetical protein
VNLPLYLGLLRRAEEVLGESFQQVADGHADEPDVFHLCHSLAKQCAEHDKRLRPVIARYGEQSDDEPDRFHADALAETRSGPVGLLRDLQDLYVLASFVDITWTVLGQAAQGVRDQDLLAVVRSCDTDTRRQLRWLTTRIKQAAPQALIAGTGST